MATKDSAANGHYFIAIDDDPLPTEMIETALGLKTFVYASSKEFQSHPVAQAPKGVFVDIHLGINDNGLDLIPGIRSRWPYCPVIVVTGDLSSEAVGKALASGAHDYIRKPFVPSELYARWLARSVELSEKQARDTLCHGDFILNMNLNQLSGSSGVTHLSHADALVLCHLVQANGSLSRKDLKKKVWGNLSISDNALDKKVKDVRKALKGIGSQVKLTSTYGEGFSLVLPR